MRAIFSLLLVGKVGRHQIRSFVDVPAMAALAKFQEATEAVYGPLASNEEAAKAWTPPQKSGGHRGRYLWTDAFGVINFITLSKEKNDPKYLVHADRLSKTVHDVLGRTRNGSARLPGASDENPVGGGLRIGKEDEGGSDGDGQYVEHPVVSTFRHLR